MMGGWGGVGVGIGVWRDFECWIQVTGLLSGAITMFKN